MVKAIRVTFDIHNKHLLESPLMMGLVIRGTKNVIKRLKLRPTSHPPPSNSDGEKMLEIKCNHSVANAYIKLKRTRFKELPGW